MSNDLLYEVRDGVAHATLNRPQARNALTPAMYDGLARVAGEIAANPAIGALVIRGAGDKAFASGSEISQFLAFKGGADGVAYERHLDEVLTALERCPKPVIAAIAGACTGGGAAIAAVCDLRIGARSTRIGVPVARTLGNCLSIASLARFVSLIGAARTTEMMLTGRLFEADEAKALGFLNEVVEGIDELDARVDELARSVAALAPLTLRATKEQMRRMRAASIAALNDDDLVAMCYGSEDFRQGVEAFVARRAPLWKGR